MKTVNRHKNILKHNVNLVCCIVSLHAHRRTTQYNKRKDEQSERKNKNIKEERAVYFHI